METEVTHDSMTSETMNDEPMTWDLWRIAKVTYQKCLAKVRPMSFAPSTPNSCGLHPQTPYFSSIAYDHRS